MKIGITKQPERIDLKLWRSLHKRARAELLDMGAVVLGADNLPEIRDELLAVTVRDIEMALGLR